jgi:hypothetical protein
MLPQDILAGAPMADATEEFLAQLVRDIEELTAKADQKKQLVNQICADRAIAPRYADAGGAGGTHAMSFGGTIRRDHFHGRKMATAIREYLEMRGASDRGGLGAATVNEIYAALVEGGFTFETKNDLNAKRGLRDALMKNSGAFHRVGDAYGLVEWYPKPPRPEKPSKKPKRKAKKKATPAPAAAKPAAPKPAAKDNLDFMRGKPTSKPAPATSGDNVVDLKQPKTPAASPTAAGEQRERIIDRI